METIMIIDDDDQLRKSFEKLLREEGYGVIEAPSAEAGLKRLSVHMPDVVILDIRLPGMSGLDAFKRIHKLEPKLPVIIMTAYGTTDTAIEATKLGAFDYVLKPFDIPEMLVVIRQALDAGRFMRSPVFVNALPENHKNDAIIGSSPVMQEIYKSIGRVSTTDATVLIRGESGTGKELVARAIYQHSLRADKPFLVVNCVAIPDTLLESELFGYEKGAFTGASHRRIGKIEQASGGTIFFDEIGDMPLSLQAKILRLLQEKSIERLGGRQTIPVDVRIIAATNRNLEKMIETGQFREDLYYRLKVVSLWLPSLMERPDDIPELAAYFMAKYSFELGIENAGITKEAMAALSRLPWAGNIRELANTIQKILIFNRGNPISREDVINSMGIRITCEPSDTNSPEHHMRQWIRQMLITSTDPHIFDMVMDRFAAMVVSEALIQAGGNRTQAARNLGVSRPTLHAKIEKYGIQLETIARDFSSQ